MRKQQNEEIDGGMQQLFFKFRKLNKKLQLKGGQICMEANSAN